jgi:hypothetical protein
VLIINACESKTASRFRETSYQRPTRRQPDALYNSSLACAGDNEHAPSVFTAAALGGVMAHRAWWAVSGAQRVRVCDDKRSAYKVVADLENS